MKIEERLHNMKNLYYKIDDIVDMLPDGVSDELKTKIKNAVLGDEELKKLMKEIDSYRPPRIFLVGRTGVGKSSLINALCGAYVAKVSDTVSCTSNANICQCKDDDRVLMEILDTRGIAESESLDESISAEEALLQDISSFSPDIAVFMLSCTHRDDIVSDVTFLKKVADDYFETNKVRLPIVVVVNKCDEMRPSWIKESSKYTENKISKINEVVQYYKSIIVKNKLKIDNIIPVSSLIGWKTKDGMEIAVEDIEYLPEEDIKFLQIGFDGRYRIEDLFDILYNAIQDFEAQAGLRMAARLNDVVKRLAKKLITIFTTISGIIAMSPIPFSDIYALLAVQTILVAFIARLSGRDISFDTAKEFIASVAGVAGAGLGFRTIAQQAVKLLSGVGGAGMVISSTIASSGTKLMGDFAIKYYIDGFSMEEIQKNYKSYEK